MVEYSVEALLRHFVPPDVAQPPHHERGRRPASVCWPAPSRRCRASSSSQRTPIVYELPLAPAVNGLLLRGQGYRTSIGLISNTLFWMVVALSVLTVWMLLGTWRHMRRRAQIQAALVQETNFRRAMENSMLTGMRAMDLEGRITYVNAGLLRDDRLLRGRRWSAARRPSRTGRRTASTRTAACCSRSCSGRSPAGGIEVRVMRKDGSLFDARMYVSPLIDPRGQQTGWMTSMTNITEAKRIRDQLSASHERFTTVLEGLDASVSVLSVQQGELLFANRSYRLWFGADAGGHALLAGNLDSCGLRRPTPTTWSTACRGLPTQELTEAGSNPREVFVEPLQKWFDVRARYLQWTDGRLAQMLIATDITARLRAEEQAAQQAEQAQVTSRLVTMGEMASSVAHELNQPLTAITNYCNGMVSRVEADSIDKDDLLAALRKTARQAERAGQIIHRIRAFVKKQRAAAPAGAGAADRRGRGRTGRHRTAPAQRRDPHLRRAAPAAAGWCDPILIEQVLLNLLKNAAEAIDSAQLPASRRNIELRVVPRHTPEEGGVIEFSVTDMRPGPEGRSHRAAVRSLLLDQGRRPGHRPVAVPHASSSRTAAGCGRRTSTMARPFRGVVSPSPCRSKSPSAARPRARQPSRSAIPTRTPPWPPE